MGTWGPGLYECDYTLDIKDTFDDLQAMGFAPMQIQEIIQTKYADVFSNPDEGNIAKLALAELLYNSGSLPESIRLEALSFLQKGGDLEKWSDQSRLFRTQRQKEFLRLEETLLKVQKNAKELKRAKKAQFNWQIGDVYAVPITIAEADEIGLTGQYIILYFHKEAIPYKGFRIPWAYAKITRDQQLPQSVEQLNSLEFIQTSSTKMEDRFRPFPDRNSIPPEYCQDYQPDKWGFLPEYLFQIIEAKGHHPPDDIVYLGNFPKLKLPHYEYFRYKSCNGCSWTYLQEQMLLKYKLHNLHQAKCYK